MKASHGLLIAVGVIVLLTVREVATNPRPEPSRPRTPPKTQQAAAKDFEQCRAKLKKAEQLEVLYDLDWKPPKEPRVVAGPTFFTIPIDAKEGFTETVNCFLTAGDGDKCVNFDVLHWQTGKPVGRFANCRFRM